MFPGSTRVIFASGVAGVILLQASTFLPQRDVPASLPADAIVHAVATGNSRLLELAVAEKVDVNGRNANGRTALFLAVQQQDGALIQRLLEAGASVDVADAEGVTPLMLVARQEDGDLLRKFVDRSTDVNALDGKGWSAAHHAVEAKQADAVELLVPLLPQVDEPTRDGPDLIAMACATRDLRIVEAVLTCAPDALPWTPHTRGALDFALAEKSISLTRTILSKHATPPLVEGRNVPLLAHAIVRNERDLFAALLDAGADPNTTLPVPHDKEFVAQIRSKYFRAFAVSEQNLTVLMLAAGLGSEEYVRALLAMGADKNRASAKHKMLALYFAARTENWKCVQLLLGRGPTPEELRVEISLANQRASVFKNGVQVFQTAVSTGRKGFDTPAGSYVITDKKRSHRSTIYHVNMPFFMRLNGLDFGLHAGVVPNYPASHGCIRVPAAHAQKLFAELPVGTLVTIN
ncbi:hypothetical protein BH20VER2_BH20VER2_13170 [soil metagenome]|nr:ankyrin repeat domain-containing protein [Chthoniobacterales bacterium]